MHMRTIAALLLIFLAGCAAQAASAPPSIDVNALVRAHPLYGTLAQYDRQIAALRATLHVSEFAKKDAAFTHAEQGARNELDTAASRARNIAAMPSPNPNTLTQAQNVQAPSESAVRSDVQRTYSAQSAQVRVSAQQDLSRYRSALIAQQNAAFASYVRAMQARVQQAYDSRAQQLYERESTLGLDLAKADADKRLPLRAKLQTLHLDPAVRARIHTELAAIQAHEDRIVNAQRAKDRASLAKLLPQLQKRADADIARMHADLDRRTAVNLAARQRVYDAQMAGAAQLHFGAAPEAASRPANMRARLDSLLASHPADPAAFTQVANDLTQHFATLHSADTAATRRTEQQIAALQAERTRLYNAIVAQIMRDAQRVQREHPGTNVTQAVRADLAALSR